MVDRSGNNDQQSIAVFFLHVADFVPLSSNRYFTFLILPLRFREKSHFGSDRWTRWSGPITRLQFRPVSPCYTINLSYLRIGDGTIEHCTYVTAHFSMISKNTLIWKIYIYAHSIYIFLASILCKYILHTPIGSLNTSIRAKFRLPRGLSAAIVCTYTSKLAFLVRRFVTQMHFRILYIYIYTDTRHYADRSVWIAKV